MTDRSDQHVTLEPDEPPKSGVWVDVHDVLANPTPDEAAEGERLGREVLPDPDIPEAGNALSFLSAGAASDYAEALTEAKKLKAALLKAGVPEVEIRLVPGRPNSYGTWSGGFFVADMGHHIVSRLGSNKTPGLKLVIDGRSDLPGPLCNGYGGFDLCARIICMSYANHPGAGGPITVPATKVGSFTIPRDSARRYAFGWEFEGGLNVRDWDTPLTNPRTGHRMTFREFMDRCLAGTQDYANIPTGAHLEHSTWTSRKIDRLGISRAEGIAGLARYRTQEDDMPDRSEFHDWVRTTPITTRVGKDNKPKDRPLEKVLDDMEHHQEQDRKLLNAINGKLDKLLGGEVPEDPKSEVAAHDVAFWNVGDRTIKPEAEYVANAIEALLTGTVGDFLKTSRPGLGIPPRGPVAVVGAAEMGDQGKALALLEARGYGVSKGPSRNHMAKELFVYNPALVKPVGEHRVTRLAPATDKGRRNGRTGYVDMGPMYLHLQDFENLATGVVVTSWVIHYNPSVSKNAERTRQAAEAHAAALRAVLGASIGGGDFNMTSAHKLAKALRLDGWSNSHDALGVLKTFRHKSGRTTAIDWAMWRDGTAYTAQRQLAIDMPGQERGKTEHYVLVIEADVKAPAVAR